MRRSLLLLFALLLIVLPVQAQDGRGTLRLSVVGDFEQANFAPFTCPYTDCLADLLFPRLLYIDPVSQSVQSAPPDRYALVTDWQIEGARVVLTLREDLRWSDGTPITAYDVFFSYQADLLSFQPQSVSNMAGIRVLRAAPLDAYTIAFTLNSTTCDSLLPLNLTVLPVHAIVPTFQQDATAVFADGDTDAAWERWREVRRARYSNSSIGDAVADFFREPSVSAGPYRFLERQYNTYIRLISADGARSVEIIPAASASEQVDLLLRGDTNLVFGFDPSRMEDLRADPEVRVLTLPTDLRVAISLNVADPHYARTAVDEDGNPVDQGQHPLFSDPAVRRALQMATNVPALLAGTLEGLGTSLANVPYDPLSAAQLLEAAGWKDVNGDGVRECITCTTAREGRSLSFELRYSGVDYELGNLLHQQWSQVGFNMQVTQGDDGQQTYDAALIVYWPGSPASRDATALLTPAGDSFFSDALNRSSYNNPDVTALLDQARRLPGCDVQERDALYDQADALIAADQPLIWLFAPMQTVALRTSIAGTEIYPGALFWNIEEWVIGS